MTITPKVDAHFCSPGDWLGVQDYIVDLINSSDRGSTIRMSIYLFNYGPLTNATLAAFRRGVHVKIVVDKDTAGESRFLAVQNVIGKNISNPSFAVAVGPSGGVGTGINHDKFFTFSSVNGKKNVMVQSSANMTYGKYWNAAITLLDHDVLYKAYVDRFNLVVAATQPGATHPGGAAYSLCTQGSFKSYFFPQPSTSNLIVDVLGNIDTPSGAHVDIACYQFQTIRVMEKLNELANQGAHIRVITVKCDPRSITALNMLDPTIVRRTFEAKQPFLLHSKYMLVGPTEYAGVKNFQGIWSGSTNYADSGFYSQDEAMMKVKAPGANNYLWGKFRNNYEAAFQAATPYRGSE